MPKMIYKISSFHVRNQFSTFDCRMQIAQKGICYQSAIAHKVAATLMQAAGNL